jgi:NRPS condensation-like uncharacterized protein
MNAAVSVFLESTPASLRALGPIERYAWLVDQHRPFHFSMAMEVFGTTTPEQWRRALNRVQKRHPMLSACIHENQEGWPEFCFDGDRPIRLQIRHGHLESWVWVMESELGTRFDPQEAPLARAVLLYESRAAILVLSLHHAIADGMSGVYIFRDLLRVLAGEEIADLPMPDPSEEWVRRSGIPALAVPPPAANYPALPPNEYRIEDGQSPLIHPLELSSELSVALRAKARREQTTIHGALAAAFFMAGREWSSEWAQNPVRVVSPLDLRRRIAIGEACGFFAITAPTLLDAAEGDGFWDLARLATRQIQPAVTPEGIAQRIHSRSAMMSELDFETTGPFVLTRSAHEAMLTNLGELPYAPTFKHLRVEAIWGPALLMGTAGEQVIGASSLKGGGISLLHTSFTPFPGLLERMESLLAEACAG